MTASIERPDAGTTPRRTDRLFDEGADHFFVHRDIYRDPEVLEWELRYLFESGWNLVGLDSQVAKPFDFFTTHIGRVPVVVTRDAEGDVHCLLNSCRHKGAMVCHHQQGTARSFVCQYHGWAYDAAGRNIRINDEKDGAYAASFDALDHDLLPVAQLANYRGLLFASLTDDVPPLDDHLGDLRTMIDLVVDQSPLGIECVPGRSRFVYRGNWKLQMENGVDPYHFASTHRSYIQALQGRSDRSSVYSGFAGAALERGTFSFPYGHNAMWGPSPSVRTGPMAEAGDALLARVGEVRARWMTYVRNATLFPNAQFAENAALQLRIWRPLAVDRTEMRTWCIAPIGESDEARAQRIRLYEEFFNPGGLATPDDIANYEDCQRGFEATPLIWGQGTARGERVRAAAVPHVSTTELGVTPVATVVGPFSLGDETVLHGTYGHWRERIEAGLARDGLSSGADDGP